MFLTYYVKKVKVKWSRYRPGVAQRLGWFIALLFHDRGTRRGWVVSSTPRQLFTPREDQLPIYRRLGVPHGPFGRPENLVTAGIQSRTVQPVITILCSTAKCELISGSGTDISVVSFSDTNLNNVTNSTDFTNWSFMTISIDLNHMTPGTVVVWTSIYFATSVIWLVISGLLIYGRLHKKHAQFLWPLL